MKNLELILLKNCWQGNVQIMINIFTFILCYTEYNLFCRCYLKLGYWQEELQGLTELSIPNVLEYYFAATFHDPCWYKAWHSWAYMNFETVLFYKHQQNKSQANDQNAEKGVADKTSSEVNKLVLIIIHYF